MMYVLSTSGHLDWKHLHAYVCRARYGYHTCCTHYFILMKMIETTGIALAETLAYLALNPEAQSTAHSEIVDVLGDRDPVSVKYELGLISARLITTIEQTLGDLPRLTHTAACFYEALRLYRMSDSSICLQGLICCC